MSNHPLLPTPSRRAFLAAMVVASAAGVTSGQDAPATNEGLDVRTIPSSGARAPSIGLGTWQQFDIDLTDAEAVAERKKTLQSFYDAGGRLIDSSPMYRRSEAVVGKLTEDLDLNADFFFATKVWTRGEEEGRQQMRQSFDHFRRERLELMQVHNLVDADTHLKTLRAWKEEGRLTHIGVSHYTSQSLADLETFTRGDRKVDVIQLPYNVENQGAEKRLLPACRDNGVATIINIPFGGGGLFGKVRGRDLPEHARRYAESWAQAFLKFILANKAVTCIIPGTNDPEHAADNCGAMRGPLPTEEERRKLLAEIA